MGAVCDGAYVASQTPTNVKLRYRTIVIRSKKRELRRK